MAIPLDQIILARAVTLAIGLFFAVWVILGNLIRRLIKGPTFFEVKERKIPPKCITDPQYGRHNFIKLKEVKLHYVENGDRNKPLMLFLHGWPEFWFSWRHQMKHFAATHWCVAIDLRGFGDSDKPSRRSDYGLEKLVEDIKEVIEGLDRDSCTLVTHDWGGLIAWAFTAHNQNMVKKLVIMNSPHPETYGPKVRSSLRQFCKSWYVFVFQVPYVPEWMVSVNDLEIFEEIFLDENKQQTLSKDEIEAFKYTFSGRGAWTPTINYYRQNFPLGFLKDKENPCPKIHVSTLFIWGEDDVALTRDFPDLAKPFASNLTIKYIAKGNHFIQQDKPKEVNAAIQAFL